MTYRYWAKYRQRETGPFDSRHAALAAMRRLIREKGLPAPYRAEIMTGYGQDGAWFDIQWTRAAAEEERT